MDRIPSCPRANLVCKSLLTVSGGCPGEWLRLQLGEEVAAALPTELGGELDLESWGWEG